MRFRFTFWATFFTIPAVLFLIGLGVWQLQRLHWKNALIAARTTAVTAPPASLPPDFAHATEYRRVMATGTFLNDRELFVGAFSRNGNEGFQIVTPMRLEDGSVLLVDRGWVPRARKEAPARAAGQISGQTMVEGLVRSAATPQGFFLPANDPGQNFWFYVDVPAMARASGLQNERVRDFYIDAGPALNPGGFPIGGQTPLELPNDHLQYAITWFLLAGSLVVIFLIYHHQKAPGPGQQVGADAGFVGDGEREVSRP